MSLTMTAPLHPLLESSLRVENAAFRRLVEAGHHYIGIVRAGQTLRLVDVEGNEAADTLFFNAHDTAERYSAMDTVREQGQVYLGNIAGDDRSG